MAWECEEAARALGVRENGARVPLCGPFDSPAGVRRLRLRSTAASGLRSSKGRSEMRRCARIPHLRAVACPARVRPKPPIIIIIMLVFLNRQ